MRYTTARGTETAVFSGGVLATSNLPLSGHHGPVLAALADRLYVVNHEPTDEQIVSLIYHLADRGSGGLTPQECRMVASQVLELCQELSLRPSIRLYTEKAVADFLQCKAGHSEADWRDLLRSNLAQQAVTHRHPISDLSQRERSDAERRIALDAWKSFSTKEDRLAAWIERTGKSQAALYRRWAELRKLGLLKGCPG